MNSRLKGAPLYAAHLLSALLLVATAPASEPTELTLRGTITGADHQTYRLVPFEVPAGTERLTIEFDYAGRDQRTVVDLGLVDPNGIRGWSGGNKRSFTVSSTDATPSYRAGPLPAGTWKLLLGLPNVRQGVTSQFSARIRLYADAPDPGSPPTAGRGPGWYRGDFHAHTGHSDGSCQAQSGAMVPCPVNRTLDAAAARGLDFIAVTDHNTASHLQAIRELQPAYDKLLVIPGMEVTTFAGHANVFGVSHQLEFRGITSTPDGFNQFARQVRAEGGLVSINHPGLPSGEACMGCGWSVKDTDYSLVDAIEVVNGGAVAAAKGQIEGPASGLPFWEARLHAGRGPVAIGGSDNHNPGLPAGRPAAIGRPTTVVHAQDLTTAAILSGVKSGRVFIDVDGTRDRLLDLVASAGGQTAAMGGRLVTRHRGPVRLAVSIRNVPDGSWLEVLDGRRPMPLRETASSALSDDAFVSVSVRLERGRHPIRVNVHGPDGRLLLIGNPIEIDVR